MPLPSPTQHSGAQIRHDVKSGSTPSSDGFACSRALGIQEGASPCLTYFAPQNLTDFSGFVIHEGRQVIRLSPARRNKSLGPRYHSKRALPLLCIISSNSTAVTVYSGCCSQTWLAETLPSGQYHPAAHSPWHAGRVSRALAPKRPPAHGNRTPCTQKCPGSHCQWRVCGQEKKEKGGCALLACLLFMFRLGS